MDLFKKTKEQECAALEFDSQAKYFREKSFEIRDSVEVNEHLLKEICPPLRSLMIIKELSGTELSIILQHCVNLELLELWSDQLILDGLSSISKKLEKIKHLDIDSWSEITDIGMSLLTETFPNLEDLTLRVFTSPEGFQHIVNHYTTLISLDIEFCDVTQQQIKNLVENNPKLVSLHIEHSNSLREEGLEDLFKYLSEKYPHLAIYFH
jgi:hypothetical protein